MNEWIWRKKKWKLLTPLEPEGSKTLPHAFMLHFISLSA